MRDFYRDSLAGWPATPMEGEKQGKHSHQEDWSVRRGNQRSHVGINMEEDGGTFSDSDMAETGLNRRQPL